ncbi:MAG: hypothetical protein C4532_06215 [Candidatus Abyssobacteria bacterium SURF_17]|uniref:Sulfatase N-terminal domain-containing protein n=1 Tax=Candidatus Abyssobacteria bacterium SURF_17 TaxID=2093361 RepID=A0A419F2G8_9BACT|nr:MAG: hypothetical protein C4532_06215 [Candidatus Abyssubacteria bacterium SURF_17]
MTSGIKFGIVAGMTLAAAETFWIGLSSENVPVHFLVYLITGDIILMGFLGGLIGLILRFESGKEISSGIFASALIFVTGFMAIYRSLLPGLDGAVIRRVLAAILLGALCVSLGLIARKRRLFSVRKSTETPFVMMMLIFSFGMISGLFMNKLYLPDFASRASLVANAVLIAGWTGAIVLVYLSYGKETTGGRRGRAGVLILIVVLFVSFLNGFFTPYSRFKSRPLTRALPEGSGMDPKSISVILVVLDTVRADHLSAYGYSRETTPNISALVNDSLLYRHAVSTSSTTLPAHASLFTGLLPTEHGADFVQQGKQGIGREDSDRIPHTMPASPLSESATTLAEVLAGKAYSCGAIAANCAYLWRGFQLDQGFHHYDDSRGVYIPLQPLFDVRDIPAMRRRSEHKFLPYRDATVVTNECIDWLKDQSRSPFFLFVNYMDAHAPYAAPPRFREAFAQGLEKASPPARGVETSVMRGKRSLPPEAYNHLSNEYDAELLFLDSELGRLMNWLKDNDLFDGTLIVITSDHGESLGEHMFLGHTNCLYEQEIFVPLLVKFPHADRAGRIEERTVSLAEVPNIILNCLNLPPFSGLSPYPIAELLRNQDRVSQYGARFDRDLRAVYEGNFKYIYKSVGETEVYDLRKDPAELVNVASIRAEATGKLFEEVKAWEALAKKRGLASPEATVSSKDGIENLKALGYLN